MIISVWKSIEKKKADICMAWDLKSKIYTIENYGELEFRLCEID